MPDHSQGRTDPMPEQPKQKNRWVVTLVLIAIVAVIMGLVVLGR